MNDIVPGFAAKLNARLMPAPHAIKHVQALILVQRFQLHCNFCAERLLSHGEHIARGINAFDVQSYRPYQADCAGYPWPAMRNAQTKAWSFR